MEKIILANTLGERIKILEGLKTEQERGLKEQIHKTYELLKPANLIKSTVKELAASEEFKGDLLDGALGFAAGLLAKKAAGGSATHPLKAILGLITQAVVSKTVAVNAGGIRKTILNVVHDFLSKKDKPAS